MNKVAKYLNEHIEGEVDSRLAVRSALSTDRSGLSIVPEMIVHPRSTVDIRKIARFSWQLAEKGHTMSLTMRGSGSDSSGGAIGGGMVVAQATHLHKIFELDDRQRLIRMQPGVAFEALNSALLTHGMHIPGQKPSIPHQTIGGAVATDSSGRDLALFGSTGQYVRQLEVVLANGDILQTERISRRELNKRKGRQTLEGEIYRKIDGLIDDNSDLIKKSILSDSRDNFGYPGIANVKQKDGSFDLTPLFIASQGTLGIISELIMKTEYRLPDCDGVALAFRSPEAARDAVDEIRKLSPSAFEILDGRYIVEAEKQGKRYDFYDELRDSPDTGFILFATFVDMSSRLRARKVKRLQKNMQGVDVFVTAKKGDEARSMLYAFEQTVRVYKYSQTAGTTAVPLLEGIFIPRERLEEFTASVDLLAKKFSSPLLMSGDVLESIFNISTQFHFKKVTDRQKMVKLLDQFVILVDKSGGHLLADAPEGRMNTYFTSPYVDEGVGELYAAIKNVFDPYNYLNPGVKQPGDIKQLAKLVRTE